MTKQNAEDISFQIYCAGFVKVFGENILSNQNVPPANPEIKAKFEELFNELNCGSWQASQPYTALSILANVRGENGAVGKSRYFEPKPTGNTILLPTLSQSKQINQDDLRQLKQQLENELKEFKELEITVAMLGFLAKKYLSNISLKQPGYDAELLPLCDVLQVLAAIISTTHSRDTTTKFTLAALDVSGIQEFVYNISSARALRSLRGRSFFLEILAGVIIQQLLEEAGCSDDCIIVPGGGYYTLLLPQMDKGELDRITNIISVWNRKLFHLQEGRLFLAFAVSVTTLEASDLLENKSKKYSDAVRELSEELPKIKSQKFAEWLDSEPDLMQPQNPGQPCDICRRHVSDPNNTLEPLEELDPNSDERIVLICDLCHFVIKLGEKIPEFEASNQPKITIEWSNSQMTKWTFEGETLDLGNFKAINSNEKQPHELKIALNPRKVSDLVKTDLQLQAPFSSTAIDTDLSVLAGKPSPEGKNSSIPETETQKKEGWKGLAAVQADVDNLGELLRDVKNQNYPSLIALTSLSRLLTLFFANYTMQLERGGSQIQQFRLGATAEAAGRERKLQIIYGGGDDFFGIGSWDDALEFALDLGCYWKAFVGYNQNVTLSIGISLHDPKFPVSAMAKMSHDTYLEGAKNHKDKKAGKSRAKDSLYVNFARRPLFWDDIFQFNEASSDNLYPSKIIEELVKPLYTLLPNANQDGSGRFVSRAFLRRLMDADAVIHPLKETHGKWRADFEDEKNSYAYQPQGLVSLLYTLVSARERETLQNNSDWKKAFDYLKTVHENKDKNPPDLSFYLTWLDLLVRSGGSDK